MKDVFVSVFIVAALALIFAHAWTMVSEQTLLTLEKKNPDGSVARPLRQLIIYAVVITIACWGILYYIHYHTDVNLGAGHFRAHRPQ